MTSEELQARLKQYIPWVLAVSVGMVLAFNVPTQEALQAYMARAVVYGLLTAFVLLFGVWLSRGRLSPAHIVGMVGFLSLPTAAQGLLTWSIFLGGVIGGALLALRPGEWRYPVGVQYRRVVMVSARVTLSFFAASAVYIALDGSLPLEIDSWEMNPITPLALLIYGLVYLTMYVAIYTLELYINEQPTVEIIKTNLALIAVTLLLPIPFAILTAQFAGVSLRPHEIVSLLGLLMIVVGLHAISRSESQMRRQLDEMAALAEVARALRKHLDLPELLETVYLQVTQLLAARDFTLLVYDGQREHARLVGAYVVRGGERFADVEKALVARLRDYPLLEHVLASGEPLFLPDEPQDGARQLGMSLEDSALRSWVGVPLQVEDAMLGVLAIGSDDPYTLYSRNDYRLLRIVADNASIALENAQLFLRQAERVDQLESLNAIGSLLSGTLASEDLLDTVVSSASTLSGAHAVGLHLLAEEGRDAATLLTAGLTDSYYTNAPSQFLMYRLQELPRDNTPIVVNDLRAEKHAAAIRPLLEPEGVVALVELPLLVGSVYLGTLALYYHERQAFTREGLEVLRTFVTQAAQAISNAHTYAMTDEAFQRSVDQLLTLANVGRTLTSTIDLKSICDQVLHHVLDATRATAGAIALYDEEGGALAVMASDALDQEVLLDTGAIRTGLSRRALETGKLQQVGDDGDADLVRLVDTSRSQLCVPIMKGRDVLGVITVESHVQDAFGAEDDNFIAQIANQAVIAIENARLFQSITEARDRLKVMLDTMEEAIILVDSQGEITLANPKVNMLGIEPESLVGYRLGDGPVDDAENLVRALGFSETGDLQRLVNNVGQPDVWEEYPPQLYVVQQEDEGALYIQRYIIPLLDDTAQTMGALMVFYDKTDEQELNRAREELTRMIVHDLRSPLTAVLTSLKLLRDHVDVENPAYNLVQSTSESSRQAVHKLLGRVDSLLDISKMQNGRLAIDQDYVDMRTLIDNVHQELLPLSEELHIRVTSRLDAAPLLYADPDKAERLLLNLVDNALKYSPTGSQVTIHTYQPGEAGAAPGYIRVDVADEGPGVPQDYRETLFDSFVQVKGRRGSRRGVGLGLSFCKLVAEAHGGLIWVEDNRPKGSVFAFTLPVARVDREAETEDLPAQGGQNRA